MPEHTPEPWFYDHDTGLLLQGNEYSTLVIAELDPFDDGWDGLEPAAKSEGELNANGRLMAAAPELLRACKGMAAYIYSTTNPAEAPSAWRDANRAIARAEGGDDASE